MAVSEDTCGQRQILHQRGRKALPYQNIGPRGTLQQPAQLPVLVHVATPSDQRRIPARNSVSNWSAMRDT